MLAESELLDPAPAADTIAGLGLPTAPDADPAERHRVGPLAAEPLFAEALGRQGVLSRSEEDLLARQITRARARIRSLLRGARRLSRAALAARGRGVVSPEQDFREREAVAILRFAEQQLHRRDPAAAAAWSMPKLRTFVGELRQALAEYRTLRDQMVLANVRLVAQLTRRYHHPTLSFLDLFQEGTFGLMRAVEKYQPTRGVKFSTYASWWIWQQLGRSADMQGDLVRTPVQWNQLRRRVGRLADDTADDLADAEGIASERFAAMTQAFRYVSTEADSDDGRPLSAVLAAPGADPETQVAHAGLVDRLAALVETLPPREQLVIRRRFGLDGADPHTLEILSGQLGVSRERVRQLEMRALQRLRAACLLQELDEYLR